MDIKEDPVVMYLIVNKTLNMSEGKSGSQIGHCVEMIVKRFAEYRMQHSNWPIYYYLTEYDRKTLCKNIEAIDNYNNSGTTKIVLGTDNLKVWKELKAYVEWNFIVVDEGRTEVAPNSETVIGFFPMHKSKVPEIIKGLKLL